MNILCYLLIFKFKPNERIRNRLCNFSVSWRSVSNTLEGMTCNSFQPDPIYVLYFFWNCDKERDGENVVLVLKHQFLIVRSLFIHEVLR